MVLSGWQGIKRKLSKCFCFSQFGSPTRQRQGEQKRKDLAQTTCWNFFRISVQRERLERKKGFVFNMLSGEGWRTASVAAVLASHSQGAQAGASGLRDGGLVAFTHWEALNPSYPFIWSQVKVSLFIYSLCIFQLGVTMQKLPVLKIRVLCPTCTPRQVSKGTLLWWWSWHHVNSTEQGTV